MFAVDADSGERPLGLYTTAQEAAIACDEAVLRQGSVHSQAPLNHPVECYQHVSSAWLWCGVKAGFVVC